MGKFQRVGHSADTVDLFDELILGFDGGVVDFLGRRKDILDQLEDVGVGGQGEHQHDHAAYPRCNDEFVL